MANRGKRSGPDLERYRRKRAANRTPEPFGGTAVDRPGLFVVHQHAATRLHWDLRLEMGGALVSWAVPKGPSLDPAEKRLAVHVEDHPLEYGDFEGVIPAGNYGAGEVIVWDRGRWVPIDGPKHGIEHGKLLFDLEGYKLRGRWTLVKTSRGENEWLLIKKPDGYAREAHDAADEPNSVLSGLTVVELRDGSDKTRKIGKRLKRLNAVESPVDPATVAPMLAEPRREPFDDDGWVFELKYDGYRLIASRGKDGPHLRYRRGMDVTRRFPEIARAVGALPYPSVVLDGELVALDAEGKPSFQRLQQRVQLQKPIEIDRASVQLPVTLMVFDLLGFDRFDLRELPLLTRKELLAEVLPAAGPLRYADHIEAEGKAMFAGVQQMGLEGIVAKRADAPYRSRRSAEWLKIRADRTGDFVIVGFTAPKGGRSGFGALHVAAYDDGTLIYAGRVGSGFDEALLGELHAQLSERVVDVPACEGELPPGDGHSWVAPELACEVRYKEWTEAGNLRHPVFLRLRDDKPLEDCVREREGAEAVELPPLELVEAQRQVSVTNVDKVFWPEEGYTKGDLIAYYRSVSPWLLPFLKDRPVVLTRYPDGIEGKHFFQKDAPAFAPDWIRIETMWSEGTEREIRYFIIDDEPSLAYIANLGTIPLHIWSSRVGSLQNPDWCILDLDPKEAPFAHVIKVAREIKKLCDAIELPCFVKTSGSSGLHVLVPLGGACTYEQSKMLGNLLAQVVVTRLPKISTIVRNPAGREGKVYVDFLQNGHGKLLVSPYCVRPLPGAPVSAPLRWSEVKQGLTIEQHTIATLPKRLAKQKRDPLIGVLDASPDLGSVLERLGTLV